MCAKKVIFLIIVIYLCIICKSNAQNDSLEIINFIKSSCYDYLRGEDNINSNFSGIDTVECSSMHEKIKILRFFEKGKKVLIKAYYDNGNLYEKQSFLNNEFDGVGIKFYKNGKKKSFYYYENGQEIISIYWYENGLISSIIEGEQHKGDYYMTTDYDTLGNIINRAYRLYPDPLHDAFYDITYYPCSSKKIETIYNDGAQPYTAYYQNGNTSLKGTIFQGDIARIGKWQEWYDNGIMKREYYFNDTIPNMKEKTWRWWDNKGKLTKEERYKNGVLIYQKEFNKKMN
jgi:antitoxin component YwqK of YwqJK toxin-antitoxin module